MKTIRIILALLFLGSLISCTDFLEVEVPKDQVDQKKAFNDDRTATSALTQVYTDMRNSGFLSGNRDGVGFLMGCYADELEVTVNQADYKNFYEGTIISTNNAVGVLWNRSYRQIYMANNVLEGLEESTGISNVVKNQLRGEALAVRGIIHFYLTQTFGAVPYVTSTDYTLNVKINKLFPAVVMNRAIEDLEQAQMLLNEMYPSVERVRINKSAVQGFLARLYLYAENWDMAKQYAETVINNPLYELEPLENTFLKESRSALLQFKPSTEGGNALEANTYIFSTVPAPQAQLSAYLLDAFEPTDLRKSFFVKNVGSENGQAHAFKYTTRGFTSVSKEYSVVLRLEEMYLISAEAAAELNDMSSCNLRLNVLRNRAGLPAVDLHDKQSALEAVLRERRIEMFCEFGHRFYDLKRKKRLNDLLVAKPFWQEHFRELPIPYNEIMLNPNLLPQNQGY